MLVIIGDGRGERHRSRHPDLSERDNKRLAVSRWDDVAHDATFVAGI